MSNRGGEQTGRLADSFRGSSLGTHCPGGSASLEYSVDETVLWARKQNR